MIGKGAWGSAIASLLGRNEHEVAFLQRDDKTWPNEDPGEMVFLAIPCQNLRQRLESLPDPKLPVVSLIKGIEIDRFLRVTEIIRSVWSNAAVATISGPSFASEVIENAPTAAVVASDDEALAIRIQDAVHQKLFRLYRSTDLVGVELGGALKNVYALAGGMCSGLGIGENGMAALMTRSLAEMSRIA
ncbi:MAG: NAD(P)-dependent glycerol-3-phosphate dehydrogenase, partial [Verrucomicrobiota bacterium]